VAEIEVFGHGHFGDELELLVDDGDAGIQGLPGRTENAVPPVQNYASGVGRMDAAQDLQQRRLPRSVLAYQGSNFAGADPERDVPQSADPWKRLRDAAELNRRSG